MKKTVLVMLVALLLAGCSTTPQKQDDVIEQRAVNQAVSYLNDQHGYDTSKSYVLEGPFRQDGNDFPRLYVLYEDRQPIGYDYMFFSKDMQYGGMWCFEYQDGYVFYAMTEELLVDYGTEDYRSWDDSQNRERDINDKLYLENVKGVEVQPWEDLSPIGNEKLKEWLDLSLSNVISDLEIYELPVQKAGDHFTIKGSLPEYVLQYDKESQMIVAGPRPDVRNYPVYRNGEMLGIITVSLSDLENGGLSMQYSSDDLLKKYIDSGVRFIEVGNILITEDGAVDRFGNDIFIPVIIQKALPQLQEALRSLPDPEWTMETIID